MARLCADVRPRASTAVRLHCAPMRRVTLIAVLAACCSATALAQPAPSEPDPRAEQLNERGKSLYSDKKDYAGAAARFRQAIAISPDARYYYNLCAALEKLGKYEEALNACDEVFNHDPRPELGEKTGKRAAEIRRVMRTPQPPTTPPSVTTPPPGTTTPPPNVTTPPPVDSSAPPPAETEAEAEATLDPEAPGYRWSLGADIGFVRNGTLADRDFGQSGLAIQAHVGAIVASQLRLGVELYLHLSAFGERTDGGSSRTLTAADLGAAAFWHKRIWRDIHFTPAAGLHVSSLTVDTANGTPSFGTGGIRLEAAAEWRFGGGRHVVRVAPISLNYYFGAGGRLFGADFLPEDFGLDDGGTTWSFTIGYTYRFEKPPFPGWTLE